MSVTPTVLGLRIGRGENAWQADDDCHRFYVVMTRTCVVRLIDAILKGIKEPGTTRMDNCCDDAHSVCRQFSTGPHFPCTHTIHVCVCLPVCRQRQREIRSQVSNCRPIDLYI